MTRARPRFQPKKLLLASVSIAVPTATGFLSNTGRLGLIIPLGFLSVAALPFFIGAVGKYRPKAERWMLIPAVVLFIGSLFPAGIGGHSVWLTAFGETVHCRVLSVDSHSSSRGSTKWTNELDCGGRKLTYWPSLGHSVKDAGTEMDVVVDKTGFVGILEPGKVNLVFNLFFLLGLLLNAGLVLAVARLPLRQPAHVGES